VTIMHNIYHLFCNH